MTILVLAEHDGGSLKPATLNTITAAAAIGGEIHVLVAGDGVAAVAEACAKVAGVARVLVAESGLYAHHLAEPLGALIVGLASGYSHILAPATSVGKSVMPRVAALLDVAQISEITAVVSADTFVRPIYAGNALATVQSADAVKVITVVKRNPQPGLATICSPPKEVGLSSQRAIKNDCIKASPTVP